MLRLLCFFIFVGASLALYPTSSDVVDLNPDNFDTLVLNSDKVWIVEFFAPWCGHCKNLVPEYSKSATALKGIAKVGAVNAEEHKSLASKYGVRGFPTIKVFGVNKNSPQDFNGQRTAQGIVESALAAVKDNVLGRLGVKSGSKFIFEKTSSFLPGTPTFLPNLDFVSNNMDLKSRNDFNVYQYSSIPSLIYTFGNYDTFSSLNLEKITDDFNMDYTTQTSVTDLFLNKAKTSSTLSLFDIPPYNALITNSRLQRNLKVSDKSSESTNLIKPSETQKSNKFLLIPYLSAYTI